MRSSKTLIAALAFAGLTACADNTPKTFSGFITDASMNTVTVRALTDESTCTFATTAADKSDANGLLLGAPVTVDYTGKLKDGAAATKIATDPTYAEAVGKWTEQLAAASNRSVANSHRAAPLYYKVSAAQNGA